LDIATVMSLVKRYGELVENGARFSLSWVPLQQGVNASYQLAQSSVDALSVVRMHADATEERGFGLRLLYALLRCFQVGAELLIRQRVKRKGVVPYALVVLEAVKVAVRLLLRRAVGSRLCSVRLEGAYAGRRTGRRLRSLKCVAERPAPVTPPLPLGEAIGLLRPIIHAGLFDRHDWLSWITPVALDGASFFALRQIEDLTEQEQSEITARINTLPYAVLRSPFFDVVLTRPTNALATVLNHIPVLNQLNIVDYLLALRPLYFSTSGT
jgi:hypothetical protein